MIIVADFNGGGLCNRILLYVHCLAYGLEFNQKVLILNDEEIEKCFNLIGKDKTCKKGMVPTIVWKVSNKLNKIIKNFNNFTEQD